MKKNILALFLISVFQIQMIGGAFASVEQFRYSPRFQNLARTFDFNAALKDIERIRAALQNSGTIVLHDGSRASEIRSPEAIALLLSLGAGGYSVWKLKSASALAKAKQSEAEALSNEQRNLADSTAKTYADQIRAANAHESTLSSTVGQPLLENGGPSIGELTDEILRINAPEFNPTERDIADALTKAKAEMEELQKEKVSGESYSRLLSWAAVKSRTEGETAPASGEKDKAVQNSAEYEEAMERISTEHAQKLIELGRLTPQDAPAAIESEAKKSSADLEQIGKSIEARQDFISRFDAEGKLKSGTQLPVSLVRELLSRQRLNELTYIGNQLYSWNTRSARALRQLQDMRDSASQTEADLSRLRSLEQSLSEQAAEAKRAASITGIMRSNKVPTGVLALATLVAGSTIAHKVSSMREHKIIITEDEKIHVLKLLDDAEREVRARKRLYN